MISLAGNGSFVIEPDPSRCPFRRTEKCSPGELCSACGIYREANRIYEALMDAAEEMPVPAGSN